MRKLLTASLFLAASACSHSFSPFSARAKEIPPSQAPDPRCERIGDVSETSYDPWSNTGDAKSQALSKAAAQGATHVQFTPPSGDRGFSTTVDVRGVAYRCPLPGEETVKPLPTPGGCKKDTDCKGDRICDAGVCTEPGARAAAGGK